MEGSKYPLPVLSDASEAIIQRQGRLTFGEKARFFALDTAVATKSWEGNVMTQALAIRLKWFCALTLLLAWEARPAVAQTCEWEGGFHSPGATGPVTALAVFNNSCHNPCSRTPPKPSSSAKGT